MASLTRSNHAGALEPLHHTEFRRLWLAGGVSQLGDAIGRIALTVLVQRETGSALATGAVVAAYALPFLGPGQWLTARLARVAPRRLLVSADLVRAVAFGVIALPIGTPGRVAVLVVASLATPPFDASAAALVPRTLPAALIGRAVGLRTATAEGAFVVGFAIGGLLADVTSASAVIALDALSFLASAAVLTRLRVADDGLPIGERTLPRLGDAVRTITHDPINRRMTVLTALAFTAALVPEALVATYVDEVFPGVDGFTGVLASVVAVGVIATAALRRPADHLRLARHGATVVLLSGSAAAIAFAGPDRIVLAVLAYAAIGPVFAVRIHTFTLLSERIRDPLLAPAISVASGALSAAYVVAGLGGGALAQRFGIDATCAVAAALCALIGAGGLWRLSGQAEPVSSAAPG